VAKVVNGERIQFPIQLSGVLGPDGAPPPSRQPGRLEPLAFRDAVLDVAGYIEKERRVPARVFIGAEAVPPADFLVALARAYAHREDKNAAVELGANVEVLTAGRVAKDTPGLFGGWIIHKEGFRAPKILEVARLQAWTLKPAVRKN
jgi:hypothetical protein